MTGLKEVLKAKMLVMRWLYIPDGHKEGFLCTWKPLFIVLCRCVCHFRYVEMVGLTDPCDNINFVTRQLAIKLNAKASGNQFCSLSHGGVTSDVDCDILTPYC